VNNFGNWTPAGVACSVALLAISGLGATPLAAQPVVIQGDAIPRDVREVYDRGLEYLIKNQGESGAGNAGGYDGPGVTGMVLMVLLASGEDPNFGPYATNVRKCLRGIISRQDSSTGFMGDSMYHHGFATLALAEAYGTVDDRDLWSEGSDSKAKRSIGESLELAVRCAVTSQEKNPYHGWRYSPSGRDADTSVSGAVLMGLLAARNAGIEVPDKSIDQAIDYFASMTSEGGIVGYSGGMEGFGESLARSSIASLVYSIAKRKDLPQYKGTITYLSGNLEAQSSGYVEYGRYYQAQALVQGDVDAWQRWNTLLVRQLKEEQKPDGSFDGSFGTTVSTSLNLLALAINYRFLPIYER
jgi:hypothetical protein